MFAAVKQRVREARYRAQRQVNTELIRMYWQIGRLLVEQSERAQWGDKVMERLSMDLRAEFSGVAACCAIEIHAVLRSRVARTRRVRATACCPIAAGPHHGAPRQDRRPAAPRPDWYAAQAVTHEWSRPYLSITSRRLRIGVRSGTHQLRTAPRPGASDLAQQITKGPYVFDFLSVEPGYAERELEAALVERIIEAR